MPLETWLAVNNDGPPLVEAAQKVIADYEAGPPIEPLRDDAPELDSPEDRGDRIYKALCNSWPE